MTIRKKLFLVIGIYAALSVLFSVVLLSYFTHFASSVIKPTIEHQIQAQAEMISINAAAAIEFEDSEMARSLLKTFENDPYFAYAVFYTASNKELAHFGLVEEHCKSDWCKTLTHKIYNNDRYVGRIEVVISTDQIFKQLQNFMIVAWLISLILCVLALLVTHAIQRIIVNPLHTLTKAAQKITQHSDYSLRIKVFGHDEISNLTENFNKMLAEIEQRDNALDAKVKLKTAELKAANIELNYLLTNDNLTHMLNRNSFNQLVLMRLNSNNKIKQKFAVFYIVLDNLKHIGNTFGYAFSENTLIKFSERLKLYGNLSQTVFRVGSYDFTIIVDNLKPEVLMESASQLCEALGMPLQVDERSVDLSITIGVSLYPEHADSADALLRRANMAQSKALQSHTSKVMLYDNTLEQDILIAHNLFCDFKHALLTDQFKLYLQGVYSAVTCKVARFEVLSRWTNDGNFIAPDKFIACAEENHLIKQFNEYVLRKVCILASRLAKKKVVINFSINFSSENLQDIQFVPMLRDVLAEFKLSAAYISIEITENTLLEKTSVVVENIANLRKMGIKVFLDDFGKLYSSLNYLRMFTIDAIKIDKQFIDDIERSEDDRKLVQVMLSLKQIYGIYAVAEGVETKAQFDILREAGCDMVQGYFLHKPAPAEEVLADILFK